METVNAVVRLESLLATIGSRRKRRASSTVSGAQTMPEVWRMINAIFSDVHRLAATIRSPSPSRSSSSVTTTISPAAKAFRTSAMEFGIFGSLAQFSGSYGAPCNLVQRPARQQILTYPNQMAQSEFRRLFIVYVVMACPSAD